MKKFVLIALALLVIGGAYFAYRVFSGPASAPRLADLSPAQQAARRADAKELVGKVNEIARAAKKGEPKNFTLVASQDQLNTLLQDNLKIKNAPVSDLSAALEPNRLVLSGRAQYKGLNVPLVINGGLKAKDGGLDFEIESLTLGGFAAPQKWKDKAKKAAGEAIEKALSGGQKLRFDEVQIENEKLTVKGQTG